MTASEEIDQLIAGLSDWRGEALAAVRKAILGGRSRHRRGVEVAGQPGLVARRDPRRRPTPTRTR
ncbi:MAG: hypothetical protein WDM92_05985 [Caulobacteraceae bacterium]